MRITNSAKYFFLVVIGLLGIVALISYFMIQMPQVAKITGNICLILFGCFLVYVTLQPIVSGLGERAEDILAVYPDASGKALHIFACFFNSPEGMSSTRYIQYYVLLTDKRKLLYKVLFSHSMESVSGRSGYEGYNSFEETVLNGLPFKAAIAAFSAKAGWQLQFGNASAPGEGDTYATEMDGYMYKIEEKERVVRDVRRVSCYDGEGKLVWGKSI